MARRDVLRWSQLRWLWWQITTKLSWLTAPRRAALLLGLIGMLIGCAGYLYHHCDCQSLPNLVSGWEQEFEAFYANLASSFVTIAITVFTIDWLNEQRVEQQLKAQLIREMGHPTDNGVALRAVRELWAHRYLWDGSLREIDIQGANLQRAELTTAVLQGIIAYGVNLQEAKLYRAVLKEARLNFANLQGADLSQTFLQGAKMNDANLRGADLRGANLEGANLHGADLRGAFLYNVYLGDGGPTNLKGATLSWTKMEGANLRGANLEGANLEGANGLPDWQLSMVIALRAVLMPSGRRYDGRFNLGGDLKAAQSTNINLNNPQAMADFYGVSLEDYLRGQEWARNNLPRLRREAGLEHEEAAETGGEQQPEEPQSAAPSSSAPPSPVVPTQSLLSFTVRRLIGLFWPFGR